MGEQNEECIVPSDSAKEYTAPSRDLQGPKRHHHHWPGQVRGQVCRAMGPRVHRCLRVAKHESHRFDSWIGPAGTPNNRRISSIPELALGDSLRACAWPRSAAPSAVCALVSWSTYTVTDNKHLANILPSRRNTHFELAALLATWLAYRLVAVAPDLPAS
jgi:hypothetical protein